MPASISVDMLIAFVKVAQLTSVSEAAIALGVGKSVVSKRVAQLEGAVMATLFSRSTRRIALTPAGEAYLEYARRVIGEMTSAEERLRDLRVELTGQIRLTAPISWGQHVLARRLPEFLRLHPAIEVELLLSDQMMDIAFEQFDLALRWSSVSAPELVCVPVADISWVLVAAPDYLEAAGAPDEPRQLSAHPCLCYWREHSDDFWLFTKDERSERVRIRGRYHANNTDVVIEATLGGLGIALLPRYLCDDALSRGRLVPVLEGWTAHTKFGNRITAIATPERMRISRNQALLSFLRQ